MNTNINTPPKAIAVPLEHTKYPLQSLSFIQAITIAIFAGLILSLL